MAPFRESSVLILSFAGDVNEFDTHEVVPELHSLNMTGFDVMENRMSSKKSPAPKIWISRMNGDVIEVKELAILGQESNQPKDYSVGTITINLKYIRIMMMETKQFIMLFLQKTSLLSNRVILMITLNG